MDRDIKARFHLLIKTFPGFFVDACELHDHGLRAVRKLFE